MCNIFQPCKKEENVVLQAFSKLNLLKKKYGNFGKRSFFHVYSFERFFGGKDLFVEGETVLLKNIFLKMCSFVNLYIQILLKWDKL